MASAKQFCYDAAAGVPAPLNAEILTELVFSTACLFLTIYIFYVNVRRPLFPALAVLVSLLFLWAVTSALPSTAMVSVWPPWMAMRCFVLLAAACASVAAGNWQHIPLLALSAMIMIHAHVAQLLFATALAGAAICSLAFRELKSGSLAENLRIYRYYLAAALGVIALFLLPITIDWASHHANNIHQIRAYLRAHRGEHNSFSQALLYTFSFLTYYVTPEIVLAKPTVTLRDLIPPDEFVPVFWSVFLAISTLALIAQFRSGRKMPSFLKFVFAEIVLIVLLFPYWSWKMTGPMYTFNGFFFFSVQLLALLTFVSLISYGVGSTLKRHTQTAITCACVALLLLVPGVPNSYGKNPDVLPIVMAVKAKHVKNIMLFFTEPIASLPATGWSAS